MHVVVLQKPLFKLICMFTTSFTSIVVTVAAIVMSQCVDSSNHEIFPHEIFLTTTIMTHGYANSCTWGKWLYCGICSVKTDYRTRKGRFRPQYHLKQSLVRIKKCKQQGRRKFKWERRENNTTYHTHTTDTALESTLTLEGTLLSTAWLQQRSSSQESWRALYARKHTEPFHNPPFSQPNVYKVSLVKYFRSWPRPRKCFCTKMFRTKSFAHNFPNYGSLFTVVWQPQKCPHFSLSYHCEWCNITDMLHHSLSDYANPAVSMWRFAYQHLQYVCRIGLRARDYARVMLGIVLTWCMGTPVQG